MEEKESLRKAVEDFETMMRKPVVKAARRSPEDFPDELALLDLALEVKLKLSVSD